MMNNVVQCEKGTFQSVRKAKRFLNKWYFKTYKANQGHTYTSRTRCVDIQVQAVFIRIYCVLTTVALYASISKVRGVVNLASPTTLLYRSPESQRSNGWLCKWYPLEDIDVLVILMNSSSWKMSRWYQRGHPALPWPEVAGRLRSQTTTQVKCRLMQTSFCWTWFNAMSKMVTIGHRPMHLAFHTLLSNKWYKYNCEPSVKRFFFLSTCASTNRIIIHV